MKYELIGGDERTLCLAKLLSDDENEVKCFAMDTASLPENAVHTADIEPADCYILPVPSEKDAEGLLNAKFSGLSRKLPELLERIPPDSLVIGGKLSASAKDTAQKAGLCLVDLMSRPSFTVGNAAITAEGAVSILASELRKALFDCKVLVVGYGRIGRLLSGKLSALGAKVCVMSRSAQSREMAVSLGMSAVSPLDKRELSRFDAAVNTAPAPFISGLGGFKSDCLLVELASAPGGFDKGEALKSGLKLIAAPGLPGKYAPVSAAQVIMRAVANIVKEHENCE